jgi:hypothetical protein
VDLIPTAFPKLLGAQPLNSTSSIDALDEMAERFASYVRVMRKRANSDYDIFLCYNSDDRPEVKAIAESLKERGYLPWLDEWELEPGKSWQKDLEKRIRRLPSAAIFVGRSGIGPWQRTEIEAILRLFVKRARPAIPVILPSCKKVPRLPLFLEGHTWVDFRVLEPDPLKRLIWGLTRKRKISNRQQRRGTSNKRLKRSA